MADRLSSFYTNEFLVFSGTVNIKTSGTYNFSDAKIKLYLEKDGTEIFDREAASVTASTVSGGYKLTYYFSISTTYTNIATGTYDYELTLYWNSDANQLVIETNQKLEVKSRTR